MKALVIGGARSGTGAALLLNQKGYDVVVVSRDDFKERLLLEKEGIQVCLDDRDTDRFDDVDLVVKAPGISNSHPLVNRFDHVLNEIQVAVDYNPSGKYYAISGTNGKTTTTTLLHHMLLKMDSKAVLAGNVGLALSERIFELGDINHPIALEISAFQMEGTLRFVPEVYALMNLTPDHLDRYDTTMSYYQAKLSLVERAKTFIRNIDDENISKLTIKDGKTLDLSLKSRADICVIEDKVYFKDTYLFDKQDLVLKGEHNLMNAMFAASVAYLAGVSPQHIQETIMTFTGVAHRIEFVRDVKGVAYYNDSKATNPESTEVALKAFDRIHLLLGGYDKGISFESLHAYENVIKDVYVYGESKDQIKAVFKNAHVFDTMFEALDAASKRAIAGDVVLLSPACASYDQFDNFEQRGALFKDYVLKL